MSVFDKKCGFVISAILLTGLLSGYINGLFGTGGGIILVFVLARIMTDELGYSARDVFATVIAAILPMSAVSAVFYLNSGDVSLGLAEPYLLPGIIGGILGGLLLEHINLKLLKKLFAFMVVYAGIRMLCG